MVGRPTLVLAAAMALGLTPWSGPDVDGDGVRGAADLCPGQPETENAFQDDDGCPDEGGRLHITAHLDGVLQRVDEVVVDGPDGRTVYAMDDMALALEVPPGTYRVLARHQGLGADRQVTVSSGEAPVDLTLAVLGPGRVEVVVEGDLQGTLALLPLDEGLVRVEMTSAPREPLPLSPGRYLVVAQGEAGVDRQLIEVAAGERVRVALAPRPPRVRRGDGRIVLSEPVYFDDGTAGIADESDPLVHELAMFLVAHRELPSVEIQAHTDDAGSADDNLARSQARADALRDALVARGVAAQRIVARGYGEARPIADNGTAAGRARNRRVVIVVREPPSQAQP